MPIEGRVTGMHSGMLPSVTFDGWVFVPIIGLSLTAWGFICLLYLIPRTQKNPNVRTDIYLVRASYWSIVLGLTCTTLWLLAGVLVRSWVMLKVAQFMH